VLGAVLVVLVGQKAVRIVISRLPDPEEKPREAEPLAARKAIPPLHFVTGHPRILLTGARVDRLKAALGGPAGGRFKAMVDSQLGGDKVYAFQGHFAAFLYRLTGDPRYGKYAVSYVDGEVAADERKIAEGKKPSAEFDSYLLVGERIGDIALTYDWCFDLLSPAQKQRWLAYADQAVWNVWNPTEAAWSGKRREWTGWSIDNPNNNYYSSFLEATMLLGLAARGEHPRAETWVKEFRQKHIGDELGPTFDRDLSGGGSREGTGYGNHMRRLYRLYDWWESATGERLADLTPHTKASLLYAIHSLLPTRDRLVTIGDQARESTGLLFDSHRDYVQTLTYLFRRDPLAGFGQWYLNRSSVKRMDRPFMFFYDVLYQQNDLAERPIAELYPTYYAPGVGHLFARSGWQEDATWLGFLAGPLTESHAHRDLGSFLIFKNEWLAYDAGIDSKSGLKHEEAAHNLVELTKGGKPVTMQTNQSARMTALEDHPEFLYAAADVTPMYEDRGGVSSVQRELVFIKPDTFVVFDRVATKSSIAKTWHLSTPHKPLVKGNAVSIQGKKSNLTVTTLLPRGVKPAVVEWPNVDPDIRGGYRVDVAGGPEETAQFLTVLWLDGAVTRVSERAGGSTGPGADLGLKDGRTVRVTFQAADWGGGLEIAGGGRAIKQPLKAAVARLPILAR
jgi:hypothetical protein